MKCLNVGAILYRIFLWKFFKIPFLKLNILRKTCCGILWQQRYDIRQLIWKWLHSPTWWKLRTVLAVWVCLPGSGSADVSTSCPVCFRYSSNMASGTTTLAGRGLRLNPKSESRLASTVASTSEFSLRLLLLADLGLREEHAGWRRVASSTGRTISNPRIVGHTPAANMNKSLSVFKKGGNFFSSSVRYITILRIISTFILIENQNNNLFSK